MPSKAKESQKPVETEDEVDEEQLFNVPTILEPDTYLVKCVGLRRHEWDGPNKFDAKKENISIMWNLEFARIDEDGKVEPVLDENTGEPYQNEQSTTTAMSAKSKAFEWATAFLRREPTQDEVKRLNSVLKGKKAMAVVGQKENGYPKIINLYPYMGK